MADIKPGAQEGSYPRDLISFGGLLYFTADDGVHGTELWAHNASSGITTLVRDVLGGGSHSSGIIYLTPYDNQLYFTTNSIYMDDELRSYSPVSDRLFLHTNINSSGGARIENMVVVP